MVEDRLKELFLSLPEITDLDGRSHSIKSDFGSEEDCHTFLNDNRSAREGSYPLVWIQTPFPSKGRLPKLNVKLKLILATISASNLTNDERVTLSFEPILEPLLKYVIKGLDVSGFTKMLNTDRDVRVNHFKYSVDDKNQSTDVWDAITYECEILMSECPLREFNF